MNVVDYKGNVYEVASENILANDVIYTGEYNPHNVSPYVIYSHFGPWPMMIGVVWASNEQDALDVAVDNDMMDRLAIPQDEMDLVEDDEVIYLGNASEAFYSDGLYVKRCNFDDQPLALQLAWAEARGACADCID